MASRSNPLKQDQRNALRLAATLAALAAVLVVSPTATALSIPQARHAIRAWAIGVDQADRVTVGRIRLIHHRAAAIALIREYFDDAFSITTEAGRV
jgi:hypothetical protein